MGLVSYKAPPPNLRAISDSAMLFCVEEAADEPCSPSLSLLLEMGLWGPNTYSCSGGGEG
jgi:hypothetical protein